MYLSIAPYLILFARINLAAFSGPTKGIWEERVTFTGCKPWPSLVAQMVKSLPAMRETQVQSLGCEDLLEKEMATHSSLLTWKIPQTEELGSL